MNHVQNLRELSRQLLNAGWTLQADECDEAARELERLEAILADVRTTGRMIIIDGENWIAIPRAVWMEVSK